MPLQVINLKNAKPQNFPFPKTMMDYIFKNLHMYSMKMLRETCKYFAFKFPYNFVHTLRIYYDDSHLENLIPKEKVEYSDERFQKIYLFGKLRITDSSFNLQTLYTKIAKFNLRELQLITNGDLSWNDFQIITESKTIEKLRIHDSGIKDGEEYISFDRIMACIPNAFTIKIKQAYIGPQTIENLLRLERNELLWKFGLIDIHDPTYCCSLHNSGPYPMIDIKKFCEFLKKNTNEDSLIFLSFVNAKCEGLDPVTDEYIDNFAEALKATWADKEKDDRPEVVDIAFDQSFKLYHCV